ncbi:hypothetical protein I4U23_014853 [Adineta vaga]|nr:hypothetical protein I4U23_014853 [Adineta vaga]
MAHGISDENSPDTLDRKIGKLADWIRNAKHFIVFTGAGVSTSTGMNTLLLTEPDVWELRDHPGSIHSLNARTTISTKAIPSVTHMALVELARRNLLHFVV